MTDISIAVQAGGFDPGAEYTLLRQGNTSDGATAMFVGNVRDFSPTAATPGSAVETLELEHYPGMAESALEGIAREASQRWPLGRVRVIHRYGRLAAGDEIVFVGATSAHRRAALDACAFIMDFLKSRAPFWKKELVASDSAGQWVEAKKSDEAALQKW
ncbi:molybdenum cofactor biosynthesis protein MoaE [Microbulbifer sp. SA54]|uniref:molybdenum cofactor biosynthesis protein MoaE n=1 Tax=Microbulbifer sp. SA54 TaxID=3401577 RepID=UPI003AAA92E5